MSDQKPAKIALRFEDRPELTETFVDSVGQWHFDGSTLRIDFLVTRFDEAKSPDARSGRKLPACRLVLSVNGAVELLNEARRITAVLEKAGLLKVGKTEQPPRQTN